jgi:hypothetical protein
MKVCYFIQTHKNPTQIYRLVRTIKQSSSQAQIIIGHDFTASHLDISPLQDLEDVHVLKGEMRAVRGDFSLIQPYFNAINWLLENQSDFAWLVYISGQDYPTQPVATIEDFLSKTEFDGFIRYWDVLSTESIWGKGRAWKRYFCQYYRLPQWTQPLLKLGSKAIKLRKKIPISKVRGLIPDFQFFLTYGPWVGIPAKKTPFNSEFICYGGYQWHSLSRRCVQYLQNHINQNPDLIDFYKKTVVPDESVVQTILVNSGLFNLCNDDKRYFDTYEQFEGHARLLTSRDHSLLTHNDFHFARKFDIEQDENILNLLDKVVLN